MKTMRKLKSFLLALLMSTPALAQDTKTTEKEEFNWDPVMDAIIWHESRGNPRVVCGIYVGVLQISPIMVRECNNILKQRGQKKRYQLDDRYSPEKSKEMFKLIMLRYNPENDIDKACRIWKGGQRYSIKHTQPFVNWVHRYMEKQKEKEKEKENNEQK